MKAESLRIGNYVEYNIIDEDVDKWIFCEVEISDIADPSYLRPIPITEQRLTHYLGFEMNGDCLYISEGRQSIMIPRYNEDDDFYVLYQEDIGCGFNPLRYVEFIHEIQNLWHSLTGKELVNESS